MSAVRRARRPPIATAATVGLGVVLVGRTAEMRELVDQFRMEVTESRLAGAGGFPRWACRALRTRAGRWVACGLERVLAPGLSLHFAARKRAIAERLSRAFAAEEWPQVVIVGAGFDGLGPWLVQEHRERRVIEVDHPATSAAAGRGVGGHAERAARLSRIGVDLLASRLSEALGGCAGFDPQRPTVFVLEGVLMYLDEASAAALMREVGRSVTGPAAVLVTFLEPDRRGRARLHEQRRVINWWLAWRGERFRWAIRRGQLGAWLRCAGWEVNEVVAPEELRQLLLQGRDGAGLAAREPILHGECLATARMGRGL